MKDLLKVYAPLVALVVGFGLYWVYGTVAGLKAQNELLAVQIARGCKSSLESQGWTVLGPEAKESAIFGADGVAQADEPK